MKFSNIGLIKKKILLESANKKVLREIARVFNHKGSLKNLDKHVIQVYKKNPELAGRNYDYLNHSSVLQKIFMDNNFMNTCGKLLQKRKGTDLTFNNFQFFIMLPGSKVNNLGWHQDSSYFPYTNQPNTSLVTWTSFSYKNKIDGNIELIPSSHLRGKINHKKNIFDKRKKVKLDKRGMYYLEKKKLNGFPKPVSSDTCSGETVFFDTNIVHRTSEAPKKNIRYTIITRHKVI